MEARVYFAIIMASISSTARAGLSRKHMSLIVYIKTGCPWCVAVVDFLREKGVTFEEREVRDNKAHFDEMVLKSGQTKAPTLDLDGEILADTDVEAVEKWLRQKNMLQ